MGADPLYHRGAGQGALVIFEDHRRRAVDAGLATLIERTATTMVAISLRIERALAPDTVQIRAV